MSASTTRQIGGVLLKPDATPFANSSVTIYRDKRQVTPAADAAIVDEVLRTVTGPGGEVSMALVPGKYLGQVRLSDADRYFSFTVPDGAGPFLIQDLIDQSPVTGEQFVRLQDLVLAARAWAENPEDEEVVEGGYSARHWAAKSHAEAEAAAEAVSHAAEWAQSDAPISTEAGGDGSTDRSAKWWAGQSEQIALPDRSIVEKKLAARLSARIGAMFDSVADLLADTTLSYSDVSEGDIIEAGGFRYEVAENGAADAHVETAGGVKVYALPTRTGYDPVSLGAVGDGETDCYAALQKAFDLGWVSLPKGDFYTASPLKFPANLKLTGAGKRRSIIRSGVIGDSLMSPANDNVAHVAISDLSLRGNRLTGAAGNGHALKLFDVASGGTASPQHVVMHRVEIDGFRGQDIYSPSVSTTISACGVAMSGGTVMSLYDVVVQGCGHGFWAWEQNNIRLINCTATLIDKIGLAAFGCLNVLVRGCHIIGYADGVPDPGYPYERFGSCGILDFANRNFVFEGNKIKNNSGGSSTIRIIESMASVYSKNRIEPDGNGTSPNKGIYAERPLGLQIKDNYFRPIVNDGPKYEHIDVYNPFVSVNNVVIEGNTFGNVGTTGVAYFVRLRGAANTRQIQALIRGNYFGSSNPSTPSVVDADIVLDTCTLVACDISHNAHVIDPNVTKTAVIVANDVIDIGSKIGPTAVRVNGGTLGSRYSGIREDVITATSTYDPPSLAPKGEITTAVSVPEAVMGDTVTVTSPDTHGPVTLTGFVESAGTVRVHLRNYSTETVDLSTITLQIRCETFKQMSI